MTTDKALHPNEVFHYTSVAGFKGIVETGTLFASDITFLNDRRELRFVDDFIRKSMTKKFVDAFEDMKTKNLFIRQFDIEDVAIKETETFIQAIHSTSIKLNPIFVCSFCRATSEFVSHNGLLSQWRGYGSDGGIALCLSREGLEAIISRECNEFSIVKGFFGDVIYGADDPEFSTIADDLEKFSMVVPDMVEGVFRAMGRDYKYPGEKLRFEDLWDPYFKVAPKLKHPSFAEEMEYRIALAVARDNLLKVSSRSKKKISFRLRGNYLVPYVILNECSDRRSRLPITRVIIGPSLEGERRRDGVTLILKENDYDIPVTISEIPFA